MKEQNNCLKIKKLGAERPHTSLIYLRHKRNNVMTNKRKKKLFAILIYDIVCR